MTVLPFYRPCNDTDPTRRYTLRDGRIVPVPMAERPTPRRVRAWCEGREPYLFELLRDVEPEVRIVEVEVRPHWSVFAGVFAAGVLFPFLIGVLR